MANQRLNLLMKRTDVQYTDGSPLLLEASALYLDTVTNNCIAQMRWRNIDSRQVKAVMVELVGYDAFAQKVDNIGFQYDNLLVNQGADFGEKTPIVINGNRIVRFDVALKAVSFVDETVWHADSISVFTDLPQPKEQTLNGDLLQQFERDLAKNSSKDAAKFVPQSFMGLWQCGCGNWQYDKTPCLKCKTQAEDLMALSDQESLKQHLAEYKDEQERLRLAAEEHEQQMRIAREKAEAEKKEREKEEERKREIQRHEEEVRLAAAKKKHKAVGTVIAAVLVFIAAAVYAVTQIFIPGNHYTQAETAYNNAKYVEAYEEFVQAGGYKDANEQAKKAAYAQAQVLLQENDYEHAYEYFQLAVDYSDAHAQCSSAALLNAQQLHAQFDYQNAEKWYRRAGNTESSTAAASMQYAVNSDRTWLHSDTQKKPNVLPENVFLFVTEKSISKYRTAKEYGVLKIGENGWCTKKGDYSWVSYYPEHELILAGTDSMCTVIDLRGNTINDVQGVLEINHVSGDGIVCYDYSVEGSSWPRNGFFNRQGKVIATGFDDTEPFASGLAAVEKDALWGYINTAGEVVIDYQYEAAESFENGYAKVKMEARRIKKGDMYVSYDEGWGLIDLQGKHVIEPHWSDVDYSDEYLSHGQVLVSKGYPRLYGLLDLNGNTILEPIYSTISKESDGLRLVRILAEGKDYYPCTTAGFVDSSGRMVINLIALGINGPYEEDPEWINGCAVLSHWKKVGWLSDICDLIINRNGTILWRGEDDDWSAYISSNGDAHVYYWDLYSDNSKKREDKYYRTQDGQLIPITEEEWNRNRQSEGGDMPKSQTESKVNLDTAFYKQWASVSSFSKEGIALVTLNAKRGPYGYVTDKEQVLVDAIYEDAKEFTNGYAVVKQNGKWGCIDANGQTVIEPQYHLASPVSAEGTLYVQYDDGTYALIDLSGQVILGAIRVIDNSEGNVDGELPMPSKLVFVRTESQNKWQLLDSVGNQIF